MRGVGVGLAVAALAAALAVHALAARSASPTTADVTALTKPLLPQLRRSAVPVLLPSKLPLASRYARLHANGTGRRGSYFVSIAAVKNCGGANACFVAAFAGDRGRALPGKPNLRLRGNWPAYFIPVSCGASCAPASLFFRRAGILYSWQVKDLRGNGRATMVALANQALAAGGR